MGGNGGIGSPAATPALAQKIANMKGLTYINVFFKCILIYR